VGKPPVIRTDPAYRRTPGNASEAVDEAPETEPGPEARESAWTLSAHCDIWSLQSFIVRRGA
jgi:hypothetical protein